MKNAFLTLILLPALAFASGLGNLSEDRPGHRLDDRYCIHYGPEQAPHEITEYFSFSCPHCIRLFLDDFNDIEEDHLATGEVRWTFHPIPVDLLTVQAMACLEQLSDQEKQVFLEEIFTESAKTRPLHLPLLMEKIVEAMGKASPEIQNPIVLEQTDAFYAAYLFVKGGLDVEGVPTIALDGYPLAGETPDRETIDRLIVILKAEEEQTCANF